MKRFKGWIVLFTLMVSVFQGVSAKELGATDKTLPIKGFAPYMQSIAGVQDKANSYVYDALGNPVAFVGARLHVPTMYCVGESVSGQEAEQQYAFNLQDRDGDQCAEGDVHFAQWYILDSGNQPWSSVTKWGDLNAVKIDNNVFPGAIQPPKSDSPSKYTEQLIIPEAALGKRIGFTYVPKTKTGVPNEGPEIKVWDLNYSFGQEPNLIPGMIDESNEGKRIKLLERFSGGGVVAPSFNKPDISLFFLTGNFMPGERLKINYKFNANNPNIKGQIIRFWWELDEQKEEISFQNENYTDSHVSNEIKPEDMGKVIFVSALPIVRTEDGYLVVGDPVTTSSIANENKVTHFPVIQDLQIVSPVRIAQKVSATYDYKYFGLPGSFDQSEYTWQLIGANNSIEESQSGVITQSGEVEYGSVIRVDNAGKMLRIIMTPKTSTGIKGETVTSEAEIEELSSINITPQAGTLIVGRGQVLELKVAAQFSYGYITEVTSLGQWRSLDSDLIVSNTGVVSLSETASLRKTVEVEFSFKGLKQRVPIEILPADPKIIEARFLGEAIFGESIAAEYTLDFAELLNDKDISSYSWDYVFKNGTTQNIRSGQVLLAGQIPEITLGAENNLIAELRLSIIPKTQSGRSGETVVINTPIEARSYNYSIDTIENAVASEGSNTIVITVTDKNNMPVESVPLNFSALDSSIRLSTSKGFTDFTGKFVLLVSKLDTRGGEFEVQIDSFNFSQRVPLKFLSLENIDYILAPGDYRFYPSSGFPKTGYDGAEFLLIASELASNSSFQWYSSDSTAASVSQGGYVKLSPSAYKKRITIEARNNQQVYRYSFYVEKWFKYATYNTFAKAREFCEKENLTIPTRDELSSGKFVRAIGSLWGEWTLPQSWPYSHENTQYWSSTYPSPFLVYMVDLVNGENNSVRKDTQSVYKEYGTCVRK